MKTYTYDEASAASISFFSGDVFAADTFVTKYALSNVCNGESVYHEKSPADMLERACGEFSRIESKYSNPMSFREIRELLATVDAEGNIVDFGDVVPQGSPLSAMGNPYRRQSLSNCFVVAPPYDSYAGIMLTDEQLAQIMKRRGGVGVDISPIRPKNMPTTNAARTTDGIGIFMQRYSNTCGEVAQGGRRGALMITISCMHPEIETFINIKRGKQLINNANISIRWTDEFMRAVKENATVTLRWPVDAAPENAKVTKVVNAADVFEQFIQANWEADDPGGLFWDTIRRMSPADCYADVGYLTLSTNPCAELPLSKDDSCRLMVVVATRFVIDPWTPNARFDYARFDETVRRAQRLMDDLVDLELEAIEKIIQKVRSDPEPEDVKKRELELWLAIYNAAKNGRRTGLGLTAIGDALAMLGVRYGSPESIVLVEEIYKHLAINSYRSSVRMAQERGTFPVFSLDKEADNPFIAQIMVEDAELAAAYTLHGRRNIANLTTAPVGSISCMLQRTSGIEPTFKVSYKRRRKLSPNDTVSVDFVDKHGNRWHEYAITHHGFEEWMKATGKSASDIEQSPYWKATSDDVDWIASVQLQAAAQRWIDHSISKTVNVPSSATVDLVKQVYLTAWESGCKGVTVYREGTLDGVLISNDDRPTTIIDSHAPRRPTSLECDIHRTNVKNEQYLVFVGKLNGRPYEVFAGLSQYVEVPKKTKTGTLIKNGRKDGVATYNLKIPIGDDDELVIKDVVNQFDNPAYGALTRTISLALRHGVPIQYIIEQLRKDKHSDFTSFSNVIARVLSKAYIKDGTKATFEKVCSECGSDQLSYQQGCVYCMACGNSRCG